MRAKMKTVESDSTRWMRAQCLFYALLKKPEMFTSIRDTLQNTCHSHEVPIQSAFAAVQATFLLHPVHHTARQHESSTPELVYLHF